MAGFNLFGKKKDTAVKADASMPAMPDFDLPPPPPTSEPRPLPEAEPQQPEQSELYEKDIEPPVLDEEKVTWPGQDKEEIQGLDKEWLEFAKNATGQPEEMPEEIPEEVHEEEPKPEEIKKPALQAKRERPHKEPTVMAEAIAKADAEGDYFVDINTYQSLTNGIDEVTSEVHILEGLFSKLDAMREKEDIEIKKWHQGFDDMRKKLLYVDDTLFESRR